jgi:hypothetical protein
VQLDWYIKCRVVCGLPAIPWGSFEKSRRISPVPILVYKSELLGLNGPNCGDQRNTQWLNVDKRRTPSTSSWGPHTQWIGYKLTIYFFLKQATDCMLKRKDVPDVIFSMIFIPRPNSFIISIIFSPLNISISAVNSNPSRLMSTIAQKQNLHLWWLSTKWVKDYGIHS